MGDAWLIIGIFVFAFILWVSTGGPDRPISFAGPYITPITDVDDTQTGYGSGIDIDTNYGDTSEGSRVWSVKSIFGRFENSLEGKSEVGVVSPQAERVRIVSGAGGPSGSDVLREYVVLRAEAETDITGWKLVSAKSGLGGVIGQGSTAPSGPTTNIVLREGDEAIVTTGPGYSFRENKCTAYLDQGQFVPPLTSRSCPSPTEELGDFFVGTASEYDACRSVVSPLPRCEASVAPREAQGECRAFIETRLNYDGCVVGHYSDEDFRGDTWRVYLNQGTELWRSDNEAIKLLDREGRTVDIYSY